MKFFGLTSQQNETMDRFYKDLTERYHCTVDYVLINLRTGNATLFYGNFCGEGSYLEIDPNRVLLPEEGD